MMRRRSPNASPAERSTQTIHPCRPPPPLSRRPQRVGHCLVLLRLRFWPTKTIMALCFDLHCQMPFIRPPGASGRKRLDLTRGSRFPEADARAGQPSPLQLVDATMVGGRVPLSRLLCPHSMRSTNAHVVKQTQKRPVLPTGPWNSKRASIADGGNSSREPALAYGPLSPQCRPCHMKKSICMVRLRLLHTWSPSLLRQRVQPPHSAAASIPPKSFPASCSSSTHPRSCDHGEDLASEPLNEQRADTGAATSPRIGPLHRSAKPMLHRAQCSSRISHRAMRQHRLWSSGMLSGR